MHKRILGLDVARALAIFGMVIVNFKLAMQINDSDSFLYSFASLFEGRASALFVILAGIGISIPTQYNIQKPTSALIKKGIMLMLLGFTFSLVWPADILHYYGIYFIFATFLLRYKSSDLLLLFIIIPFVFLLLLPILNYDNGWQWSTLTYIDFWTLNRIIRNTLYNGFHPVIPWMAFLIFGMWLGRKDLHSIIVQKKLLVISIAGLIAIEGIFYWLKNSSVLSFLKIPIKELNIIFSTSMIPPFPQYIFSATCSAVIVLISCVFIAQYFSKNNIIKWLAFTGKLSLTLYITHVIIGIGLLEWLGLLNGQNIKFALTSAIIFCVISIIFSVLWLKHFKRGPLETLFSKMS